MVTQAVTEGSSCLVLLMVAGETLPHLAAVAVAAVAGESPLQLAAVATAAVAGESPLQLTPSAAAAGETPPPPLLPEAICPGEKKKNTEKL